MGNCVKSKRSYFLKNIFYFLFESDYTAVLVKPISRINRKSQSTRKEKHLNHDRKSRAVVFSIPGTFNFRHLLHVFIIWCSNQACQPARRWQLQLCTAGDIAMPQRRDGTLGLAAQNLHHRLLASWNRFGNYANSSSYGLNQNSKTCCRIAQLGLGVCSARPFGGIDTGDIGA